MGEIESVNYIYKYGCGHVIENLKKLKVAMSPKICISRVPNAIRRVNDAAYTPQVISIGPLHYRTPALENMQKFKYTYLKQYCGRVRGKTPEQVVNHLLRIIGESEEKIRRCYEEPCEISINEFVTMILLDAVFMLEFLLRKKNNILYMDGFEMGPPSIRFAVTADLILFENQLPYFVVEKLYDETPMPKLCDFDSLARSFLGININEPLQKTSLLSKEVEHFVDLARYSIIDRSKLIKFDGVKSGKKLKYSASKLRQAGVKFEAVEHDYNLILDVEFVNGVLKLPVLEVHDHFEVEYRNIMAFEQRHHPFKNYICNFFFLMDNLINTSEDVDLLVDAGIIVHWLGSNKIFADLINKLCKGMTEFKTCYASLYQELNQHYENRWNHRKATLRLVYFSNPWRGTGTIAAALLLFMTLIQTITSIKSLF